MQLDVMAQGGPLSEVSRTAGEVRDAGFAGLWVTEGAQPAFSLCSAAALAAPGLTVGTGVAVAFARSPMVSAQAAWLLSEATGGRFVLGLGSQVRAHVERRYSADFDHPGPRLREYVAALRAIFRAFRGEEKLSFSGDFYSFSLLPSMWSPGPLAHPDPPIYLAGVNPWMCRMIGETADGMHVHPLHTARYLEQVVLPAIEEGAHRAERTASDITLACPVMTIVGDDEQEVAAAREQVRTRIGFYGSTPGYGRVFEVHGWDGTGERLRALQRAGDVEAMTATVTDEMVDAIAVTSTWDGLADALVARYGGLADRLICYSAVPQWRAVPDTFERWSTVAAQVRASPPQ